MPLATERAGPGFRGWPQGGLLALAILAAGAFSTGEAAACAGPPPARTVIEVRVDPGGAPRLRTLSAAEIAAQAAETGRDLGPGRSAAGLTTTTVQGEIGYTLARLPQPDGQACVALLRVSARLSNRDVTILLDGRYPRGSCERRAILAHERQHVRINADALEAGGRHLRQALADVAAAWQRGSWQPEAQVPAIAAALGAGLDRGIAAVHAHAGPRHATLDSEAGYSKVQRQCTAW